MIRGRHYEAGAMGEPSRARTKPCGQSVPAHRFLDCRSEIGFSRCAQQPIRAAKASALPPFARHCPQVGSRSSAAPVETVAENDFAVDGLELECADIRSCAERAYETRAAL